MFIYACVHVSMCACVLCVCVFLRVTGELVTGIIKVKLEDDILCKGVMFLVKLRGVDAV